MNSQEPAPPPALDGSSMGPYGFFRDNRAFSSILSVLLILHVVGDLALGILTAVELHRLSTPEGIEHFQSPDLNALDMAMGVVALGYLLMRVVTIVFYCIWKNRSCKNAWLLAPQGMSITPAWAVGWYFIPIALLWKPLQAMREIVRASFPEHPPVKLVGWWWTLWIVTMVANYVSFRASLRGTLNEDLDLYRLSSYLTVFITPFAMALALALLVLIRRITRSQLSQIGQG